MLRCHDRKACLTIIHAMNNVPELTGFGVRARAVTASMRAAVKTHAGTSIRTIILGDLQCRFSISLHDGARNAKPSLSLAAATAGAGA
jgi:hypothetical protein